MTDTNNDGYITGKKLIILLIKIIYLKEKKQEYYLVNQDCHLKI